MPVTVQCGMKAHLLSRDGMMGLNTFQFIWEVMFTLLYSVCIFQKVFSRRVAASQGRHRGYLDVSLGGEQREEDGTVPGSGGRERQCFPLPAMALRSRRLTRCPSFAVKWGSEHLPPYVTGFEGGDSDVGVLERRGKCSQSGQTNLTGTPGEGQEWPGGRGLGGGRNLPVRWRDDHCCIGSVAVLFSADLTI